MTQSAGAILLNTYASEPQLRVRDFCLSLLELSGLLRALNFPTKLSTYGKNFSAEVFQLFESFEFTAVLLVRFPMTLLALSRTVADHFTAAARTRAGLPTVLATLNKGGKHLT